MNAKKDKLSTKAIKFSQSLILLFCLLTLATTAFSQSRNRTKSQPAKANSQKAELIVQTGHTFAIDRIVFNKKGSLMATLSWKDGIIKLWSIRDEKEVKRIRGKVAFPMLAPEMALSDDGSFVALGFYEGTIVVVDVSTGIRKVLKEDETGISSLGFSENEEWLVSSDAYGKIIIWDIKTFQPKKSISISKGFVRKVEFSTDNKSVVALVNDAVEFWSIASGIKTSTFRCQKGEIFSTAISSKNKFLGLNCDNNRIEIYNIESGKIERLIEEQDFNPFSIAFSHDEKTIIGADEGTGIIKRWQVNNGANVSATTLPSGTGSFGSLILTPGGAGLVSLEQDVVISKSEITSSCGDNFTDVFSSSRRGEQTTFKLWNAETGSEMTNLTTKSAPLNSLLATPDNQFLISVGGYQNDTIKILRISDGSFKTLKHADFISSLSLSRDGKVLAAGDNSHEIKLWDAATGEELKTLKGHGGEINALVFSSDRKILASHGDDGRIILWDLENGNQRIFKECLDLNADSIAISLDGKKLAASGDGMIKVWDLETGNELRSYQEDQYKGHGIVFSTDGKKLDFYDPEQRTINLDNRFQVTREEYGELRFRRLSDQKELLGLILLDGSDWVVTTPEGHFDTNKSLDLIKGLQWIVDNELLNPLPLEVFMRDYYEPNLLPRLLKCTEENNCDKEFKPVRNLSELNRTQPKVTISNIKQADSPDVVQVTVEADDAVSEYQKDKQNKPLRSGVQDLRLFRDGQLVGYAPETEGAVSLDAKGKFTKTFTVRLPKNTSAKEFNFTAYAFNSDRVKSETAQKTYALPKPLPKALGSAFIVTVGVNANEDRRYDLRYAANDARRLQEELAKRLPKDKYDKIVQISLVSDYDKNGKLAENNATKAKIKAVLDKLAGKTVSDDVLRDVPNKDLLKRVQPEDLVLIAFSGHGYADREGVFYLVPHDIGKSADGGLASVLERSVSSDELSVWLRDVDAGEMMMIVDACHSAAAVQGAGFKPGPMGARGLGQLSYDKGMRILTATQADNVALEMNNLQHGLLTYSLIQNGIGLGLADYQPKDDRLFSSEWLGYAVKDVPEIYQKILKGEIKGLQAKSDIINAGKQKSNLNLQQPTLFDFNRRDRQYELINLALK